jgi:hypothetical protein
LLLQPCHLHCNDGSTTCRLLQSTQGVTNGSGAGQLIHRQKFHPFDMTHNGQAQGRQGWGGRQGPFKTAGPHPLCRNDSTTGWARMKDEAIRKEG